MLAACGLAVPSYAQQPHAAPNGAAPIPQDGANSASAIRRDMGEGDPVVHRIRAATERLEMMANSSRLLTMDQPIPRVIIANPEIVEATALSPTEIQIMAKKPGITQVNLWNEKGEVFTVDCIVSADARELMELIRSEFPNANIRIRPIGQGIMLSGSTDRADKVNQMIAMARSYYPEVQSNIQVLGVQQVMLKVKIAEVWRSKLRDLGIDMASVGAANMFFLTPSGIVSASGFFNDGLATPMSDTVRFGIVNGSNTIYGFIEALQRENLAKVLAEPVLVTYSGRAAKFDAGGEVPYAAETSINGVSVNWKKTGVMVDFVPIVLGNGNIRLEVRPLVREIDRSRTEDVAPGVTAPSFTVRMADTGVEMKPGQTLAIAGLVSTRTQIEKRGLPWIMDMPYVGALFRRTHSEQHEVELLIVVTPELVAPLDACQAPKCLPGMHTEDPNNCELYLKGYMEVPSTGPCGPGMACGPDGAPLPGAAPVGMDGGMLDRGGPPPGGVETILPGAPVDQPPASALPTPSASGAARPTGARMSASAASAPHSSANSANRYSPSKPHEARTAAQRNGPYGAAGFIGDIGYDVVN